MFGADLNFSPEFQNKINDDRVLDADDFYWERNTFLYQSIFNHLGLVDTYKIKNPGPGFTVNRQLNPMTNFSPSTRGEPEQRLDYIWFGSYNKKSFWIDDASLIFDDAVKNSFGEEVQAEEYDGHLFMSDHFGVKTTLLLD